MEIGSDGATYGNWEGGGEGEGGERRNEHEGGGEGGGEGEGGENAWTSLEDTYLVAIVRSRQRLCSHILHQLPGRDADAVKRRMSSLVLTAFDHRSAYFGPAATRSLSEAAPRAESETAPRAEAAPCAEATPRSETAARAATKDAPHVRRDCAARPEATPRATPETSGIARHIPARALQHVPAGTPLSRYVSQWI